MNKIIKKVFHDWLGWGFPIDRLELPGDHFSPFHTCQFCKYDISQDSTGAWVHLSSSPQDIFRMY